MVTLGIDLSSQPKNTAACLVEWTIQGQARIKSMRLGLEDSKLCELIEQADKIGIDAPLGWPDTFVEAVDSHRSGKPFPRFEKRDFRYRATDLFVQRLIDRWPLSVSTDRIGITAMRAVALLDGKFPNFDRTGAGPIVEVYPAAALKRWGFDIQGYKDKDQTKRRALVDAFKLRTRNWLQLSNWEEDCCNSDHAFDALTSALVARACHRKLVETIPQESAASASREGWIALPMLESLGKLPDA